MIWETWRRRLPRRGAALALVVPGVMLLAACGAAGPSVANLGAGSNSSPTPSSSSDRSHSALAFSQCMRKHGVTNFPDPGSGGGISIDGNSLGMDPNSPQFQAAQQACRSLLPDGGNVSPQQRQQMQQAALQFSQCMREHGISNFPDPQFPSGSGGGGVKLTLPQGIDAQSQQFQDAQRACQSILPKGPDGSGPSSKGSGSGPQVQQGPVG